VVTFEPDRVAVVSSWREGEGEGLAGVGAEVGGGGELAGLGVGGERGGEDVGGVRAGREQVVELLVRAFGVEDEAAEAGGVEGGGGAVGCARWLSLWAGAVRTVRW
jgi:hypothetical protein